MVVKYSNTISVLIIDWLLINVQQLGRDGPIGQQILTYWNRTEIWIVT